MDVVEDETIDDGFLIEQVNVTEDSRGNVSKDGGVSVEIFNSKPNKNDDFIKYTVTITADDVGLDNVYVVGRFVENANFVSFQDVSKDKVALNSIAEDNKPFETRNDGVSPGFIYLTNDENSLDPLGEGETLTGSCLIWRVESLGSNESRTLTYYAKLNDEGNLNGSNIKNMSTVKSMAVDGTVVVKSEDSAMFSPNVSYFNNMNKTFKGSTKNNDGSYTVKYELKLGLNAISNYPLKNLVIYDDLSYSNDYKTDARALEHVEYNANSIIVKRVLDGVTTDITNDVSIKWAKDGLDYKDNVNELGGKPVRFKVEGKDGVPLTLRSDETYYLTYNLVVKSEAFTAIQSDSVEIKNMFLFSASNAIKKFDYAVDRVKPTQSTVIGEAANNLSMQMYYWYYEEPRDENLGGQWGNGELYWYIKVSGNVFKADAKIKDAIKEDKPSYIRDDSLIGVYQGDFDIANYKNVDEFQNANPNLDDKRGLFDLKYIRSQNNIFPDETYNDLKFIAKNDISLGTDNSLHFIIKTEPKTLPTNYRDSVEYVNRLFKMNPGFDDDTINGQIKINEVGIKLYSGGRILKEVNQNFKYDGNNLTAINPSGNYQGKLDRVKKEFLKDTGNGIYANWTVKVNYGGYLEGDYMVLENIPDGMELAYIRIKWEGDDALNVESKRINNLDSNVWDTRPIINKAINDNNIEKETIYYLSKDKRQAIFKLGSFVYKNVQDYNSVDIQVVCKVTDPQLLLGGQTKSFENIAILQDKNGNEVVTPKIDPSTARHSVIFNKEESVRITGSPNNDNNRFIDYTVTANTLGQNLPTDNEGNLVLAIKVDDNLLVDLSSLNATDSDGVKVDIVSNYDNQNNILRITIPNKKIINIAYKTVAKISASTTINLTNKVYWNGYDEGGGAVHTINDYSYTSTGSDERPDLRVLTNDMDTNALINSGDYELWKCYFDSIGNIVNDHTSQHTGTNAFLLYTFTSLDYNVVYELNQITAPTGYIKDDKPHYIAFADVNDLDFINKCNSYNNTNDNKIRIVYGNKLDINVFNEKESIKVTKRFLNSFGEATKPIKGTYRFGLYDNENGTGSPIEELSIVYDVGDLVEKEVKFKNINVNSSYYIFELNDDGIPIIDTSNVQIINGLEYITYYTKDKVDNTNSLNVGDTLIVTNQAYLKELPATGGGGINMYIKSGAIIMLLAGVLLLKRK